MKFRRFSTAYVNFFAEFSYNRKTGRESGWCMGIANNWLGDFLKRAVWVLVPLLAFFMLQAQGAYADTRTVTLEDLDVEDVIYLPTVSAQRQLTFTKPDTWSVNSAMVDVTFQHSLVLTPHNSWLQVSVNDKILRKVSLGPSNAKATRLKVPIPPGILKDFNTLSFTVQQHYIDQCEDPLDKSLWTQILPESKLVFNYSDRLPEIDLAAYPYPVVDPLAYGPVEVQYVVPEGSTDRELQALAYVHVHLAQAADNREMLSRVAFPKIDYGGENHLVLVGRPIENPDMQAFNASAAQLGYRIDRGQWIDTRTRQTLNDDTGLILFFPHPQHPDRAVLMVTGNSDEAVLQAATYLTTRPSEAGLTEQAVAVPEGWMPPESRSATVPRFIERETRTFAELGFPVQSVEKINAPPILYHVPVLSSFKEQGDNLYLDLVYSYGPGANPTYSSLELRLNDVAFASIPLLNEEEGEERARATIPVPKELIQKRNTLVAQFHLMPDKYGFCVDNYEDNNWGKILDESSFRVEGDPGSLLPDLGALKIAGYPYTREANLSDTHIVLSENPSQALIESMLAVASRLGRYVTADTDLRFSVKRGIDNLPKTKNVIVLQEIRKDAGLPKGHRLGWLMEDGERSLLREYRYAGQGGEAQANYVEGRGAAFLEQFQPYNNRNVVTVITSPQGRNVDLVARAFERDERYEKLLSGPVLMLAAPDGEVNSVMAQPFHIEPPPSANWFDNIPWKTIGLIVLGVFLVMLALRVLIRKWKYGY